MRAANGVSVPAMVVFAHTLRYFRDHALRELSDAVGCRLAKYFVSFEIMFYKDDMIVQH